MLHADIINDLLNDEVEAARARLDGRFVSLTHSGSFITVVLTNTSVREAIIRLDGSRYDGEPFRVAVVDQEGAIAPQERWPGSLFHSIHPILNRPFACIQGSFEYHCHPSHLADSWEGHRRLLRLPHLLDHVMTKAGV
jgi:uncharacterized protein GlcG (DUF336 family)